MTKHNEETKCPICGKDNNCGHRQGLPDGECWCSNIKVPKALRDQIPPNMRMKACICKECVVKFKTEHPDLA